jgi:hypothetical protein
MERVLEGEAQQRRRLALAARDQHVDLARRTDARHGPWEIEQLVGLVTHRRDRHHHPGSLPDGVGNPLRDRAQTLGVTNRGAAVHLDRQPHWSCPCPATEVDF